MFDRTALYGPSPDAIESRLGDETVILHLISGIYFGLDATGTIVWEAVCSGNGATLQEACDHIRTVFDGVPETVDADISAFMTQLAENDLIRPREPGK